MINVWMMIRHSQQIVVATTHALEWPTSPPPLLSVKGHKCSTNNARARRRLFLLSSSWHRTALHSPYMLTKQMHPSHCREFSTFIPIQLDHPTTSFSSRHPTSQSEKSQAWDWMDVPFVIRQPMAMDMGADTTSSCFTHTQEHRKVWQSGCVVVASCSVTSREASDWWTTLANQDADATHHCLDSLRQVSCWCKS